MENDENLDSDFTPQFRMGMIEKKKFLDRNKKTIMRSKFGQKGNNFSSLYFMFEMASKCQHMCQFKLEICFHCKSSYFHHIC